MNNKKIARSREYRLNETHQTYCAFVLDLPKTGATIALKEQYQHICSPFMLQKNLAIIRKPAPQMMLQLLRHCPFSVNYV